MANSARYFTAPSARLPALTRSSGCQPLQVVTVSVPLCTSAPWVEQKHRNAQAVLNTVGDENPLAGTLSSGNPFGEERRRAIREGRVALGVITGGLG